MGLTNTQSSKVSARGFFLDVKRPLEKKKHAMTEEKNAIRSQNNLFTVQQKSL